MGCSGFSLVASGSGHFQVLGHFGSWGNHFSGSFRFWLFGVLGNSGYGLVNLDLQLYGALDGRFLSIGPK